MIICKTNGAAAPRLLSPTRDEASAAGTARGFQEGSVTGEDSAPSAWAQNAALIAGSAVADRLVFKRELLPDAIEFFAQRGIALQGQGTWRTAGCEFHGGGDSMRVNVRTGGWVCMACGAKGGDVLAYAMRADALDFMAAARALGACVARADTARRRPPRSTTLSARDAMELVAVELGILVVVIADVRNGIVPSDGDWLRFLAGAARIERLVEEFRS